MSLKETIERLRAMRAEPEESGPIVSTWQGEVSRLYDMIGGWLKPYVDDGGIELKRQAKTAYEERTGSYDIDQLDIDVGDETVRLDPAAAIVIGARGRIDMSHLGSGDPLILVLTGPDGQDWNVVDRSAGRTLTPLTKETFEAALDGLLQEYGKRPEHAM